MKLTIARSSFLKSLGHVQSVVERRNTIQILSNVLIVADKGRVSLTATDLDMEIVEATAADVVTAGGTTVPAHMLYDIVRKLPEDSQIELELPGGDPRVTVRAGRSKFGLASLPREDFPELSAGDLPHRFSLEPDALRRLIDRTRFAISMEETRYYLNGIYLHIAEDNSGDGAGKVFRAVATDGHRLARYQIPCPEGAEGMAGVILPRKAVIELRKLLDSAEGVVDVAFSDTKAQFQFGDVKLTSKLIDGTFPDYDRVIPKDNDKVMQVNAGMFTDAVDRVSTISTERTRAVKLALEEERLILSVTNPDSGTATEEIAVDYSVAPLEVGFNARYLMDITTQLQGEDARFLLSDANSPCVIRDAGDEQSLYVLMPMRV